MSELHLPNADAGPDSPWVAYQPHRSTDILDFACRLYSNWSSHSWENVAAQRKRAHVAEDRALPDARLLKDVFFDLLRRTPTVKKFSNLTYLSTPLAFADASVFAINPPPGFEVFSTAIAERCDITIIHERGLQRAGPRTITPRLVLEVNSVVYVVAHCYLDGYKDLSARSYSRMLA